MENFLIKDDIKGFYFLITFNNKVNKQEVISKFKKILDKLPCEWTYDDLEKYIKYNFDIKKWECFSYLDSNLICLKRSN